MNHFLQHIEGRGFESVELDSDPSAEIFYRSFGFKVIGQLETSIKNRFLPVMELEVNPSQANI
ncbi:MAG: hypothetical protein ACJA0U_003078 [Salibacteraceae bacterium]|jgi:hypothetical protein